MVSIPKFKLIINFTFMTRKVNINSYDLRNLWFGDMSFSIVGTIKLKWLKMDSLRPIWNTFVGFLL